MRLRPAQPSFHKYFASCKLIRLPDAFNFYIISHYANFVKYFFQKICKAGFPRLKSALVLILLIILVLLVLLVLLIILILLIVLILVRHSFVPPMNKLEILTRHFRRNDIVLGILSIIQFPFFSRSAFSSIICLQRQTLGTRLLVKPLKSR